MPFANANTMPLVNACPWSISKHKFIYTMAKLCPIPMPCSFHCCGCGWSRGWADANAKPLLKLCPWSISMHKFIHTFAKYNLQIPNTNAVAVLIAMAEPLLRLLPWLMLMLSHCQSCAHGQSHYTNSFILLLNTTYKCLFPFLWLCTLPWPSRGWGCALGWCQCRCLCLMPVSDAIS